MSLLTCAVCHKPLGNECNWNGLIMFHPACSKDLLNNGTEKVVPIEPTYDMWSGLARDIVFWMQTTPAPWHGSKLHEFLRNSGLESPEWLLKEIPDCDFTASKGTIAVCIYKAMLAEVK